MALSARLGNAATRRRRHRRFAVLGIVLLVVAAGLIAVGSDDDEDLPDGFAGICAEFGQRVVRERELSFPDGAPLNDDAAAEYLSHAFADTMDELVAALRAEEPSAAVAAIVEDLGARIDEIRANPVDFVGVDASPLAEIQQRFDDADLPACGSEFFGPPE